MRSFASICQYPIDPANWRENLSLPCGHVYHERCHREMIEMSNGRLPADGVILLDAAI